VRSLAALALNPNLLVSSLFGGASTGFSFLFPCPGNSFFGAASGTSAGGAGGALGSPFF